MYASKMLTLAVAAASLFAGAAQSNVDEVNARFANGAPSGDLAAAGLLVHTFHNGGDADWRPWKPCPPTCYGGPCWCATFADRFSCSIVNSHTMGEKGGVALYSPQNAGFILEPSVMKVRCAYPADGGSESKNCKPGEAGCVGGCGAKWCQFNPAIPDNMDTSCAWHAEELERVLTLQQSVGHGGYNEVVVESQAWVDNLPDSISAIYYQKGSKAEAEARKVHELFKAEFPDSTVMLLELDSTKPQAPFADVGGQGQVRLLKRYDFGLHGLRHLLAGTSAPSGLPALALAAAAAAATVSFGVRLARRARTQPHAAERTTAEDAGLLASDALPAALESASA